MWGLSRSGVRSQTEPGVGPWPVGRGPQAPERPLTSQETERELEEVSLKPHRLRLICIVKGNMEQKM